MSLLRSCPLPSLPPSAAAAAAASTTTTTSSPSSSSFSLLLKVIEFLPLKPATLHLNSFRGINLDAAIVQAEGGREGGKEGGVDFLRRVPEVVIHTFYKYVESVREGGREEGFEEHVQVREVVLGRFRNGRGEHWFGCFLPGGR